MQVLNLPSTCTIDFTNCSLSQAVINRLRELMSDPSYSGPRISYSIVDRNSDEEKSIQDSLTELYKVINKSPLKFSEEFRELKETVELKSWLSRLFYIADYEKGGDLQKTIANKTIEYLKQANENQEFRKIFYAVIQDASETCGDRVALSVLHLGISYRLSTIDLKNMKGLADFLKGVWALNMLENIARDKIPTLPFFDEIEVHLGYPIKLKEKLNLPIDIQEMLYFRCSALKDKDLEEAKDSVLKEQANEAARFKFLIGHPKWLEALSANYKEEYEALLNKKIKSSEVDNPDYILIKENFNQELIVLTKKALS